MFHDRVEVMRLKCELAKQRGKYQSLAEELKSVKDSLTNEINLLTETVEVQRLVFCIFNFFVKFHFFEKILCRKIW